jgi:chorismate synthase
MKYGIRDYRGGGRSSARETVSRVAGGAFAKLLLASRHVTVRAFTSSIGPVTLEKSYTELSLSETEENPVRCPDQPVAAGMISYLQELMLRSDTTGGTVTCVVQGAPPGWGEPVFDKLQADLAKAMLSIPAAKGFEYGDGFHASTMLGSDHNDIPAVDPKSGKIYMKTNHAGGILGGISNGEDILFRVAFKPVSTLGRPQSTVTSGKETVTVQGPPRYDPCVVPRAVPIVEAMAALVLADHFLRQQSGERIGSQL